LKFAASSFSALLTDRPAAVATYKRLYVSDVDVPLLFLLRVQNSEVDMRACTVVLTRVHNSADLAT
jgi:hypothetical protein